MYLSEMYYIWERGDFVATFWFMVNISITEILIRTMGQTTGYNRLLRLLGWYLKFVSQFKQRFLWACIIKFDLFCIIFVDETSYV